MHETPCETRPILLQTLSPPGRHARPAPARPLRNHRAPPRTLPPPAAAGRQPEPEPERQQPNGRWCASSSRCGPHVLRPPRSRPVLEHRVSPASLGRFSKSSRFSLPPAEVPPTSACASAGGARAEGGCRPVITVPPPSLPPHSLPRSLPSDPLPLCSNTLRCGGCRGSSPPQTPTAPAAKPRSVPAARSSSRQQQPWRVLSPARERPGSRCVLPPLSDHSMALIASDCGQMRSLITKWPGSPPPSWCVLCGTRGAPPGLPG